VSKWMKQHLTLCAIEARRRLLQECNTIDIDMVKAAPDLVPKGIEGQ
jgi:hypothetical protein